MELKTDIKKDVKKGQELAKLTKNKLRVPSASQKIRQS